MIAVARIFGLALGLVAATGPAPACPRIVSQSPYLTIALEWLGKGECIVGVSRYDRRDLPKTGGVIDPDADVIVVLQPELLVTSTLTSPETLQRVAPPGTRTLRVDGYASLADAEAALRRLAEASGVADGEAKVQEFDRAFRAKAAAVGGAGRRALLISACSGQPYAFGRRHVIGDTFAAAGFRVVDGETSVRMLGPGAEIHDIAALVERFHPDIVFSLTPASADQCSAALGRLPVRLVSLKGDNFFHPGPRLLDGLDELAERVSYE